MQEEKNFWQSKTFQGIIFGVLGVACLLVVFKAGTIVGAKKADFSCRWSDNYHKNFAGPAKGFGEFFKGFGDNDFIESNGIFGEVIKTENNTLIIKGRDAMEKIVVLNEETVIKSMRETIGTEEIKINDQVIIIGEPNDQGQIEAKLVRIMPPMPTKNSPPPLPPKF
jgi:RNase P/RNase MRP subunit p29